MLFPCPECSNQISDKAEFCPKCGYPVSKKKERKTNEKKNRHVRLPNGFGSITKVNNKNIRNPYRAMVAIGKRPDGSIIKKILKPKGYFKTYNEAYEALIEYHKEPYDLDDDTTMNKLYDQWTAEYFKKASHSTQKNITACWQYCRDIHDMRVKEIRVKHIKMVMESGFKLSMGQKIYPTKNMKAKIKTMLNHMFDYAILNDIIDKNYSRLYGSYKDSTIEPVEEPKEAHIAFNEEELNTLWEKYKENSTIKLILIQCYMGWRPNEMLLLKLVDVDLDKNIIIGGMKTKSGFRRSVPVHHRIIQLVKDFYDEATEYGSEWLINSETAHTKNMTYDQYKYRFGNVIRSLALVNEHRPHDCRKTFITRLKKAGASDGAIKRLVGHKITDITEGIYTDRDVEWLREDVEKLE